MTKPWVITEKIIASLQIIFGLTLIYIIFYSNMVTIEYYLNDSNLGWKYLSFYKIFKNNFLPLFKALLFLTSGILLIKNHFKGWIIGFTMWFSFGIISLQYILKLLQQVHIVWRNLEYLYLILLMILFFTNAILLNAKEFREKYKPNWQSPKNWSIVLIIIILTTIDTCKIWF